MEWLQKWLGLAYSKLYLNVDENLFTLDEALNVLKSSKNRVRIILSKLKKLGLLSIFKIERRKRYYRLLDLKTWCVLNAFEVKNLNNLRQGRYYNLIAKYLKGLIQKFGEDLTSVVIFGSVARGQATRESDIDLLIVSRKFEGTMGRRVEKLLELESKEEIKKEFNFLNDQGIFADLSYIPLKPRETKKIKALYLDMTQDALILVDKGKFFERVLHKLIARLRELGAERIFLDKKEWYWRLKPKIKFREEIKL